MQLWETLSWDAGPFSQRVLMTCEIKDIVYDVKYVDLEKKPDW